MIFALVIQGFQGFLVIQEFKTINLEVFLCILEEKNIFLLFETFAIKMFIQCFLF